MNLKAKLASIAASGLILVTVAACDPSGRAAVPAPGTSQVQATSSMTTTPAGMQGMKDGSTMTGADSAKQDGSMKPEQSMAPRGTTDPAMAGGAMGNPESSMPSTSTTPTSMSESPMASDAMSGGPAPAKPEAGTMTGATQPSDAMPGMMPSSDGR